MEFTFGLFPWAAGLTIFFTILYLVIKAAVRNGITEAWHTRDAESNSRNSKKIGADQVVCPYCDRSHDKNYTNCPYCGHKYTSS